MKVFQGLQPMLNKALAGVAALGLALGTDTKPLDRSLAKTLLAQTTKTLQQIQALHKGKGYHDIELRAALDRVLGSFYKNESKLSFPEYILNQARKVTNMDPEELQAIYGSSNTRVELARPYLENLNVDGNKQVAGEALAKAFTALTGKKVDPQYCFEATIPGRQTRETETIKLRFGEQEGLRGSEFSLGATVNAFGQLVHSVLRYKPHNSVLGNLEQPFPIHKAASRKITLFDALLAFTQPRILSGKEAA